MSLEENRHSSQRSAAGSVVTSDESPLQGEFVRNSFCEHDSSVTEQAVAAVASASVAATSSETPRRKSAPVVTIVSASGSPTSPASPTAATESSLPAPLGSEPPSFSTETAPPPTPKKSASPKKTVAAATTPMPPRQPIRSAGSSRNSSSSNNRSPAASTRPSSATKRAAGAARASPAAKPAARPSSARSALPTAAATTTSPIASSTAQPLRRVSVASSIDVVSSDGSTQAGDADPTPATRTRPRVRMGVGAQKALQSATAAVTAAERVQQRLAAMRRHSSGPTAVPAPSTPSLQRRPTMGSSMLLNSSSNGRRRSVVAAGSSSMLRGHSSVNAAMQARYDVKRRVEGAAVRLQRWWRLLLSHSRYRQQINRLRQTQAARTIQYQWLRYTFKVSLKRIGDFSAWAVMYRVRLLRTMRRLLRRELLHRRHAAIVIVRSLRWRVLRPLRALQMKRNRCAATIQAWYREIKTRVKNKRRRFGIADEIIDCLIAEQHMREIGDAEQRLEWIALCVLVGEHKELTRRGDHLEAWRLFRRRGGYDERIGRTQQRLIAAEQLARSEIAEDEAATRDNVRVDRLFQRQKIENFERERAAALASTPRRPSPLGRCCGETTASASRSPHGVQLSACARSANSVQRQQRMMVPTPPRLSVHGAVEPFFSPRANLVGYCIAKSDPSSTRAVAAADAFSLERNVPRATRHAVYTSISALL